MSVRLSPCRAPSSSKSRIWPRPRCQPPATSTPSARHPAGCPSRLRRLAGRSRSRWFSNYISLVIDKDVLDISRVRQREMLPRLLGQLAARSGQVLNMAAISGTVGLEKST